MAFRLLTSSVLIAGALSNPASAAETLGFVVTRWFSAFHETKFMDECPEGLNPGNKDIWNARLSPAARRAQTLVPATEMRAANFRGRNGEDVCVVPTSVDDPPLKPAEGKYSFGMNLDGNSDGAATPKSCRHDNFTSPAGETGVDNQMFRLMGCVGAWRSDGHIENNAHSHRMSNGLGMILIEIDGVDDRRNDDDVRIVFYRGTDPFTLDAAGRVLPYSSYGIDAENGVPRYGDTLKGKIVDGVVTSDVGDVHLPFFGNYQYDNQLLREMRLSLELSADGAGAKGLAAGYVNVTQFTNYVSGMLGAFPNTQQFSCPAIYKAAHELADGHPDKDGNCTTLSAAYKVEAVAAFINRPQRQTAEATR
ncbi:MAG: hypothetical protein FJX59_21520 [Alphaproteobacteria bacterium]|nr:hypothetical protein [Alphaproteobacteria bacterium]